MNNLLPCDGEAYYLPEVFGKEEADEFLSLLSNNINWKHDEVHIFGKHHLLNRKVSWYGDKPFRYKYSGSVKTAYPWTAELLQIKNIIEKVTGTSYNSCLLNYYTDGSDGMSWHSDDEATMKEGSAIASVSFGAERKFAFKHKSAKTTVSVALAHGSVLVMKGTTQNFWLHSLPKSKKIQNVRINLTFRTFVNY